MVPTRIFSHSATIIDNNFVSSKYLKSSAADVLVFPCSDHFPVIGSVPLANAKEKKVEKKQMCQLKKQNIKKKTGEKGEKAKEKKVEKKQMCQLKKQNVKKKTGEKGEKAKEKKVEKKANMSIKEAEC